MDQLNNLYVKENKYRTIYIYNSKILTIVILQFLKNLCFYDPDSNRQDVQSGARARRL